MEAEGAPVEEPTQQPTEVAAVSATVVEPIPEPLPEAPSADIGSVKEEVDFSDPVGPVSEEISVDLLGLDEALPTTTTTTGEGAASSAPTGAEVIVGGAPSKPPRTRGARGGKDTQFQRTR